MEFEEGEGSVIALNFQDIYFVQYIFTDVIAHFFWRPTIDKVSMKTILIEDNFIASKYWLDRVINKGVKNLIV